MLQDAARNHELERAFFAQQTTAQVTRREANSNWLEETARAFLNDPTRRAIVHPSPTSRRCQIITSRGPVHFDSKKDVGLARQVPLEAFRRYQNICAFETDNRRFNESTTWPSTPKGSN